tara:strand:+ start:9763 stop:10953 length:1191 start_codon:yes stop_codon:yes gene_type:complete
MKMADTYKTTKAKFTHIIKYINSNHALGLNSNCKRNLKYLIQNWNEKKGNDLSSTKLVHKQITDEIRKTGGQIEELWDDYLKFELMLRIEILYTQILGITHITKEIEDSLVYSNVCKQIRNYIDTTYNNTHIEFQFNRMHPLPSLELNLFSGTNSIILSILDDSTWNETKRSIDKTVGRLANPSQKRECGICFETIQTLTVCSKCSAEYCSECYINLIKAGQGIVTCPFCRFVPDICHVMGKEELVQAEAQIRANIHAGTSNIDGTQTSNRINLPQPNKMMEAHLIALDEKSKELYECAKHDDYEDGGALCDPTQWLIHQDMMRCCWETYIRHLEYTPDVIKKPMLNNSFAKYMNFMYTNYPCGFGNSMLTAFDNGGYADGCETFISLGGSRQVLY